MFNHSISRGLLLFTLRSRPPTTQAANAFSELGNLAFSGGAKLMSLFGERTTNTAASSSSDSTTSEPDLEASYAELEAVGALSEGAASLPGSAAAETGFYTVVGGVVSVAAHPPWPVPRPLPPLTPCSPLQLHGSSPIKSADLSALETSAGLKRGSLFEAMNNNSASSRTEYSYEPMARYHALAATIKPPKGAKTTEELEILRQSNPAYGSLAPRKDRPGRHEVSYDCMVRFNTLAPTLKTPRGFKDTAHLENLRQSDPCYGTLAPRKDRPGRHEVSYDCMDRYTSLAPLLKLPKGAKTVEHERHNRASNPCYGSLAPRKDRPGRHEVTYDPLERYTTLAPTLKTPKGSKSTEHLEILRQSNPCYGSLAPRKDRPNRAEYTYDPLDRYAALARSLRTPKGTTSREHKEVLRTSNPLRLSRRARYFAQAAARGELGHGNKKKGEGESSESDDEPPELPWLPSPRLEPARSGERCSDTDADASFARTERVELDRSARFDEFSLVGAPSGEWSGVENEGDYMPPTKAGLGIAKSPKWAPARRRSPRPQYA